MESPSKKVERWLRKQAFGDYEDSLSRLIVKHSPQGAKGSVIGEKEIEKIGSDEIGELTAELFQMIGDDASGMGGVQRYIIEAYHGDREAPSARIPVRIEGIDENIDNASDAEPPTKGGILMQQMRHNEVLMKTFAHTVGGAVQTMQRTIARQAEQIETLLEQRFKGLEVIEDAMSRKHERELELVREGSSQDRKDKLAEKGMMLLPVLANKLAGQKLLPTSESPRDMMLKDFVNSLEPEQFRSIQERLNPEQLIVLVNLLQSFKDEEGRKEDDASRNGKS